MEDYKREFIEFMVESDVLKFGEFTLKSGRKSPFFMNAGAYVTGEQLKRLGEYYAKAIHDNFGLDFDVVFGPAYKGIPLAVVTAIALQELYGKEVRYCCNRKEAKDHGADAGNLLGATLNDGDRVIMVEDVTTSGKSIEETHPILMQKANVEVVGLMVSLNRMEVGKGGEICAGGICRARKKGLTQIASITAKHFKETGENPAHYIAMPGTNTIWDDMDSFYALLQETVPGMEFLPPFQIGATISTHTGPGTTGFCFVKKYEYYNI